MNKIYIANFLMDLGMAGIFTLGIIKEDYTWIICLIFVLLSYFRTKQELRLKDCEVEE